MLYAIKRLTRSDLTFFEPIFRTIGAGNQKSINLNADVFSRKLFPLATAAAEAAAGKLPVSLDIYGPAAAPRHQEFRHHITKGASYKNWRLNGAFVRDPDGQEGRYAALREGDLTLLGFEGEGTPTHLDVYLVSATAAEDIAAFGALAARIGQAKMVAVLPEDLAPLLVALPVAHPLRRLAPSTEQIADLRGAALGDSDAAARVLSRARTGAAPRNVTAAELALQRERAGEVGREGEIIIDALLKRERSSGIISNVKWASAENAISPYDFVVDLAGGQSDRIDVKATRGGFAQPFYLSFAEVKEAAKDLGRYRIFRVYEMEGVRARCQRSEDIGNYARVLLAACAQLPRGAVPTAFSVDPGVLDWGPVEDIAVQPTKT